MRTVRTAVTLIAMLSLLEAADWPMPGGNPEHNGWAGSEHQITKANVKQLKLLYRYDAGALPNSPSVVGNLITYRGFKEMLLFSTASNSVFSVDADLNRMIWKSELQRSSGGGDPKPPSRDCPEGMSAPVITAGSSSSSLHFAALASHSPAIPGTPRRRPDPYLPPLSQSLYPMLPTTLTKLNALYTVTSDGYLHVLNSSTGEDLIPAVRFVPPGARVSGLNLHENVVYATTADNCDGYENSIYSIDLMSPEKTVHHFSAARGGFAGSVGSTVGSDGTLYVQTCYATDADAKHCHEAVVALTPKNLEVKDYFVMEQKAKARGATGAGTAPVVFPMAGRDVVISASAEGRVYLLDSKSLGGADHHTPLSETPVIAKASGEGKGFRGNFATWLDVDTGARRFYGTVFGNSAGADSIVAFALGGSADKPVLEQLWTYSAAAAPAPVVIGDGMVFALSTGDAPHAPAKRGKPRATVPAKLTILDATNGNVLFETQAAAVSSPLSDGLAVANGRLYFAARDNSVYCFGIPAEQSQLTTQ